jgi:transcriptional regulator with XRE-family HTH domain
MTVSDVVAERIREVRKRRQWQPADLAARCAAMGAPYLTEDVIENIESGRRKAGKRRRAVTVDELLAFAAALNVAPVHLLVPPDDFEVPYQVTAGITDGCSSVRAWIRGITSLGDSDPRQFYTEVPRGEYYIPAGGGQPGVQAGPPARRKDKRDG